MPSHERNLHKHSHGRVLTPESYNYATYLPERGGPLLSEDFRACLVGAR